MDQKYTLAGMVLEHLPDFCWQDGNEVVTMVEQFYLCVNPQGVKVALSNLKKEGKVIAKISPYGRTGPGGTVLMYRKNPDYRNCHTK